MPSRRTVLEGGAALAGLALTGWSATGPAGAAEASGRAATREAGPAGERRPRGASRVPAAAQSEPTPLTPADFEALGPCRLVPEQTQGPFYADLDLMRRDITEGRPGHPLRLGIRVVDRDCQPVPGAVVEVWHCDVDGDYSAFLDGSPGDEGPGTRFLRGGQTAGDDGIVEFRTVYPGWYTGRAVHIHTKVHVGGGTELTTQLYFPEDLTDRVHAQAPYAARGERDTRNEDDFIAGNPAANGNLLTTRAEGAGTLGLVVLGIEQGGGQQCTFWEWLWYTLTGQGDRCA